VPGVYSVIRAGKLRDYVNQYSFPLRSPWGSSQSAGTTPRRKPY